MGPVKKEVVWNSDKDTFMDNILSSTINKSPGLVAGLQGKPSRRKLNAYE